MSTIGTSRGSRRAQFRSRRRSRHAEDEVNRSKLVESRCGAATLGRAYLLPPLSSGGALVVRPWLRFHTPLARGLLLLFGLGTKALPSWDSKTRWNNLLGDLAVNVTAGSSGRTNSPHPSSREGHHSTARWSSSVLIGLDAARFSCCCCGLFSGPAELGAVNPYAVHDYSQPACQGHDRLFHPAAPGDLHRPGLEPGPSCRTHQHSTAISPPQ